MLGQRSAEDFEKWVKSFSCINRSFGRRMGLDPKVVPAMIAKVRAAHALIAKGCAKAPKMIQDPHKNWSEKVKQRDRKVCRRCGFDKNLEAHHILPQGKYPALAGLLLNGITLCGNCHALLKGKELRTNVRSFLPNDPNIENQLKELKNVFDTHYGDSQDPFSFLEPHFIDTSLVLDGKSEPMNKSAQHDFRRGKNRYKQGAYESAIKSFDQALLSQTDFPDVYLWRGKAKGQLEQHKSAL